MITAVVPAYNEEKTISLCLSSLAGQKGCEIITVAGGSDRTAAIAKKYGKVILDKANRGAGHARNLGARAAKGEVVLFTDADTTVSRDWIQSYERVFRDKAVVAAGGIVKPLGGSLIDRIIFFANQDFLYRLTALFGFYQLSGNNCGYRRKELLAAGGFDEEMSFLEDTELPLRMKNRGRVVFDPRITVHTSPRRMHKKGYARVWLQFMAAYAAWLVLGRKPRRSYFASAAAKY